MPLTLTPSLPPASRSRLQGSHVGLRAWGIAQLVRLGKVEKAEGKGKAAKGKGKKGEDDWEDSEEAGSNKGGGKGRGAAAAGDKVSALTVRRYYRPEDISREQAYKAASFYEVYASGGWAVQGCRQEGMEMGRDEKRRRRGGQF